MKSIRSLALILALSPGLASAQQFPTVPDHTVIGRIGTGTSSGPSQAIPFTTLLTQMMGAQSANKVYAGPASGSAAIPTFRPLVGADLPNPGASSLGGVQSLTCSSHNWFNTLSTSGGFGCSQPAIADISGFGTGVASALGNSLNAAGGIPSPTPTRAGDVIYWSGSGWASVAGNNSGTNCLQENSSGSPSFGSCGASVATIAALKALAPPAVQTPIYVEGYSAARDGGEGWFEFCPACTTADNGGTVIIPNSAPSSGRWNRAYVANAGNKMNVSWFGAQCGGVTATNTAAFANAAAAAQAVKGIMYFPGCPAGTVYSGNVSLQDTSVSLLGDGLNSEIVGTVSSKTVDIFSNTGCGNVHDFFIRNLYIVGSGAGGIGLHIKNAGWMQIEGTRVDGPAAIQIECASTFNITNTQGYSGSGPALQIIAGGSNSAPGFVSGGQFTSNGGSTCAIDIVEPLGLEFAGVNYNAANGTQTASICVNGASGSSVGSVTFKEMHAESNYNTTSTAADYEIGKTFKAGSVRIEGGNSWGLGDGSHSQQDFVRIFAARNVEVANATASKLAGTGFTRSMIRLESTFPAAGDQYRFENNTADVTGALYSDANGTLSGYAGDATNQSLRLGKGGNISFPGATSGMATIGPQAVAGTPSLLWPNASGTLLVSASLPLVASATTGNLTCPTCVTSSGGGAITGAAPISVSAAGVVSFSAGQLINSLGADVALNNTGSYFDGPSVGQGTIGTWKASGKVTLTAAATDAFNCKLWDGTTVIDSGRTFIAIANVFETMSLSGVITNPLANIRISCNDPSATGGKIVFNASGNSKDSTLTVFRIN